MAEWLRVVIAFGSGVAGLSVPYPHPHTTHDSILTLPVRPPHDERSAVHPRAEATVCLLTQLGFNLHDGGRFPARAQVHVLFIPRTEVAVHFPHAEGQESCSSSRAGRGSAGSHAPRRRAAYLWSFTFSTEWNWVSLLGILWSGVGCTHAQTIWGRFPTL